MDLSTISKQRRAVLKRIEELEKSGEFHLPAEQDPPAPQLLPEKVDYLCKKFSSKCKRRLANFFADRHFLGLIKRGELLIEGITGEEYLSALEKGAVVTCNHFSPCDNYIVFHCIRSRLPKKYLYKVIREGNYTNFPGLYGFFFRHCNTLPLSSNRRTMVNFSSAVNTLLKRGETVLIYPEQELWWNYKKPRPFKEGAFKIARRAGVPVLPTFITMINDPVKKDESGYPLQRHTLHVLPPVYPDLNCGEKEDAKRMCEEAFGRCKEKYEEIYNIPLVY